MGMYDVAKDSFVISKEMDDRAVSAMNQTWNAIASDCMELDEEMDGEGALEVVLDANHMESYGQDDEAAKYCIFLCRFHEEHLNKLFKKVY